MGAQRTPLRPTFSPARLGHVVYASFSGGQMETILAWDSTSHGGIMPEGYLHLTYEQRCQIYALLQSGHSQAYIARQIGVDRSTISRELVRNTGVRGYRFKQAHDKASRRPTADRAGHCQRKRRQTTHLRDHPDYVTIIRERHAFEGQKLAAISSIKRRGVLLILVILPNGSRSLIPASWTDWRGPHDTDPS